MKIATCERALASRKAKPSSTYDWSGVFLFSPPQNYLGLARQFSSGFAGFLDVAFHKRCTGRGCKLIQLFILFKKEKAKITSHIKTELGTGTQGELSTPRFLTGRYLAASWPRGQMSRR